MKLEKEFEVKVKRTSRRRTISLEVKEGYVQVIVPNALSEKENESIGSASMAYFVESLFPLVDNFEIEAKKILKPYKFKNVGDYHKNRKKLSTKDKILPSKAETIYSKDDRSDPITIDTADNLIGKIPAVILYNSKSHKRGIG